jgi:uncharacterized protein YjbI with pentapeptide repeats
MSKISMGLLKSILVGVVLGAPQVTLAQDNIATLRLTQSCSNCDFTGQNFPFSSFAGYQFSCADFSKANLEEANFESAKLVGSFKGANLRGANFSNAFVDTSGISRCPSDLRKNAVGLRIFGGADLRGATMKSVEFFHKVSFEDARLDGAIFTKSIAKGSIHLTGAKGRAMDFEGFGGTVYADEAVLTRSDFKKSRITWHANNANFSSANFDGSIMTRSTLTNSDFSEASFVNANLTGTDFSNSDLTDADLTGATLTNVRFEGTILCNTIAPDGAVLFTGCVD